MKNELNKNKSINIPLLICIFLTMMLAATCDNIRGIFVPEFQRDFGINNTQIGFIVTMCTLSYTIFTYFGGIICEKLGQKYAYISGLIIMVSSLVIMAYSKNYSILLVGMFCINAGQGMISIASNTIIPIVFVTLQAVIMNSAHFTYGLGASIAQKFAGNLLYRGISWRSIYICLAIVATIILIVVYFSKIPREVKTDTHEEVANKSAGIYKNKIFYFYIFSLGFYVFAEIGTGVWLVNYIERVFNYNKNISATYPSIFFMLLALGRLVGGFIIQKLDYLKTVCISLLLALILYTVGIGIGESGLILIAISGLFFSITFPTTVLTINKIYKVNSTYITGVIITISSIINMIMNFVIGALSDTLGIKIAFWIIPISLFIAFVFTILIYKNYKEV